MNQKLRRVFFAGLGTACALILTDPVTVSAGTWSNQDGPNQWKYFTDDTNYAADGCTGSTAIRTVWRNATISIRTA